ncbi:6-pyruvoyl trahydropterin synthase family protein [Micromonospora aurantiaca (nom. illeg.)]|uniref:6-pyruvoyl trahydropterin synthase family protein n=1 Tax=Micromonospora aurantiaca (nom. illeg.) TaxID=47850 RepID=UPI003DA61B34
MHRIGKQFRFEAAHSLPDLPEGHQCSRVHGHSYTVEVHLVSDGELHRPGFVVDFAELAPFGAHVRDHFDHRDLNTVLDAPPTSEHLAAYFYHWCCDHLRLPESVRVEKVRVSETASTFAEYGQVLP